MTDSSLVPFLVIVVSLALLVAGVAAGIVCMVRTRRSIAAGMSALKTVADSSMDQLRSMSVEELTALDRQVAGLSASGVIALAFTMSLASRRIAAALDTKVPEA